ncbi:MAG TPA: 3-dehydroquinate synthase [Streptosporangiaceae bacterium]|nr:3-dehydroquinate synthase [Streptosporangiaceae bacterium]
MSVTRIKVGGEQPYDVLVGTDIMGELPGMVGDRPHTVVLIHAEGLENLARSAREALTAAGHTVHQEGVPAGEAAKDIAVATELWSRLAALKASRSDTIIGLGGGAVTDLAGFVASTWMRGMSVVLLPTTLLGIADAAIGGKTAINIPAGKNLVGAFHSPAGVLADLGVLRTLPRRQYVNGIAEVIKAGFIADPMILDLIERDPAAAVTPGGAHERELVERAIRMKADVVAADVREAEAGRREALNYGHTLGHAIEQAERYQIPHGEAVAMGMMFAAEVGRLSGRLDEATATRHREILTAVGLPVKYAGAASWEQLRDTMGVDKKARCGRVRLVVLDGLARPGIFDDPPEQLLACAYRRSGGPALPGS